MNLMQILSADLNGVLVEIASIFHTLFDLVAMVKKEPQDFIE